MRPELWGGDVAVVNPEIDPRLDATVYDRERDEYEIELVRAAVERDVPVLGICRGHQVLNIALGGTLVEDIPITTVVHAAEEAPPSAGHSDHVVSFSQGTIARSIYGESIQTNSWHHQAVRTCGPGVVVTGRAGDGSIESIELSKSAVLGVQWHPEWHLGLDPVFSWFIRAARGASSHR